MAALRHILSAGVAAALLAGAARAEEPGSRQTRDYLAAAVQSDTFEMMEAYSALAESRDPQVRAFAARMIQDHGRTSAALRDAAARSGLKPPPMAVGAGQAPLLASLQSRPGGDFDRVYWEHQALAHRAALVTAQLYAADGDAPAVRAAAAAAVPVISGHLAQAERMRTEAGAR